MNPIDICSAFAVPLQGVIHVGANHGREYLGYSRTIPGAILFFEAMPHLAAEIAEKLDASKPHFVRQAVVGETPGQKVTFNIASNDSRSSSFLPLGRHAELRPGIRYVETFEAEIERLDDIIPNEFGQHHFNYLVIDVQGADLQVLKGGEKLLQTMDAVYVEVATEPLYEGGSDLLSIHSYLHDLGFIIRHVELNLEGWGNAFFTRAPGLLHEMSARNLARGKDTSQSSTFGEYTSERAVNGDLRAGFNVHTANTDEAAWWMVDLGELTKVERITYLDRLQLMERNQSLIIEVSRDGQTFKPVYNRASRALRQMIDLRRDHLLRYVRLRLTEAGPLHFRQLILN